MTFLRNVCFVFFFILGIQKIKPLLITEASYYTADHSDVTDSMWATISRKLFSCLLIKSFSHPEQFRYIYKCHSSHIKHCTSRPYQIDIIPLYPVVSYCGNIHLPPGAALKNTLSIYMPVSHVSQLNFLVFILQRTFRKCGPDQMHVIDNLLARVYCGIRLPWNMISSGRKCDIIITITPNIISTVTLFYQAVHTPDIRTVIKVSDWALLKKSPVMDYEAINFAQSFSFCASYHSAIIAEINVIGNDSLEHITVFDGPGKHSNTLKLLHDSSKPDVYTTSTSAFNIYITIEHFKTKRNNITILNLQTKHSKMKHCKVRNNNLKLIDYFVFKSMHNIDNYVCGYTLYADVAGILHFPFIFFQSYIFNGPDTLRSYNEGCNYGGMFIRMYNNASSYRDIALCRSTKRFVMYFNVTKVYIYVISFSGYSSVLLKARGQYRSCPTTYVANYSVLPGINALDECHYYVCRDNFCVLRLEKYGSPIGPSEVKIAAAIVIEEMPAPLKLPLTCQSTIDIKAAFSRQWLVVKNIYAQSISYNIKTQKNIFSQVYDFLHNLTATMDTCQQSPAAIGIVINYCDVSSSENGNVVEGGILDFDHQCSLYLTSSVTLYYIEPRNVEIVVKVGEEHNCFKSCLDRSVMIHEVIPDDDVLYNYNFTLNGNFTWNTHAKQGGFRLIMTKDNTCKRGCYIAVKIQLVENIMNSRVTKKELLDYKKLKKRFAILFLII